MHGIFIFDTCLRSIHRRSCGLRQAVHPILDRQRLAFSVNSHRIIHPCLHSNHRRSCSLRQAFNVHRWQLIPPHPSTFVAGLPGDKTASLLQFSGQLILHPCLHPNHRRSCSLRQAFHVLRWQLTPPHPLSLRGRPPRRQNSERAVRYVLACDGGLAPGADAGPQAGGLHRADRAGGGEQGV